jgi:hypothetical protein
LFVFVVVFPNRPPPPNNGFEGFGFVVLPGAAVVDVFPNKLPGVLLPKRGFVDVEFEDVLVFPNRPPPVFNVSVGV